MTVQTRIGVALREAWVNWTFCFEVHNAIACQKMHESHVICNFRQTPVVLVFVVIKFECKGSLAPFAEHD